MGLWQKLRDPWPQARFAEPGRYRVVLQVPGGNLVLVLRDLRRGTGLGLLEAKQLLDSWPAVVVENISENSATALADQLTKDGARAVAVEMEEGQ